MSVTVYPYMSYNLLFAFLFFYIENVYFLV